MTATKRVTGVLMAAMFVACYESKTGDAACTRATDQRHVDAIDHFVPHLSTARANNGSRVNLFVRQRCGSPTGPVVLFVQGRSAAATPSFDLDYRDYSWMAYLAD